jgi:Cd2+/Zn2+-exporting ATPase
MRGSRDFHILMARVDAPVDETEGESLKARMALVIVSGGIISFSLLFSFVLGDPSGLARPMALIAVLIGVAPIVVSFVRETLEKRFGVDALVVIAVAATTLLGEYSAAALVALMLNAGELLEDYVSTRSRRSLHALLKGHPRVARILVDGEEREVPADSLKPGSMIILRPGDVVPVDGVVLSGRASVDEAALTGEPFPVPKSAGSRLLSGSTVENGFLKLEATSTAQNSTYARIVNLVRESLARKAPVERLADRFARWFTPGILAAALAAWAVTGDLWRSVAILVVACPCSLVLATPTAVVAALGRSARRGVLIKGGDVIEKAAKVRRVLFDKTGTLTFGRPRVARIVTSSGWGQDELLLIAASAEKYSEHPLGRAIVQETRRRNLHIPEPQDFEIFPGSGVVARVEGVRVAVGNMEFMSDLGIDTRSVAILPNGVEDGTTKIYVSRDGRIIGAFCLEDTPREGLAEIIRGLKEIGVDRIAIITGDKSEASARIATRAGINEVRTGLLPEDKVEMVERLRADGEVVLMVGDGVNDAPALAIADVGVAVGDVATDASLEVADVALLKGDLETISWLLIYARKTKRTIWQNILLGLGLNIVGILLSFSGLISPLQAAALHEGNALLVVLNSARLAFWS